MPATAQWQRAIGTPGNGRRRVMVSERPYSLFTVGNTNAWSAGRMPWLMNADLGITPESVDTSALVWRARRPEGDLPLEEPKRRVKIVTCPGCGIVPPTGRGVSDQGKIQCQNCW